MREPGYYWVKFLNSWTVAEFLGFHWMVIFSTQVFFDREFNEIDERKIEGDSK